MNTEVVTEGYHCVTCCECNMKFWMPVAIHEVALYRGEEFSIWCPNGHEQCFSRPVVQQGGGPKPDGEVVEFSRLKVVS